MNETIAPQNSSERKNGNDGRPPDINVLQSARGSNAVKTVLVSGVGFLADAYDLFVIDFVKEILVLTAFVKPTVAEEGLITTATLVGAVVGQLGFGIGADFIGRRIMFIATATLVILGSVASALVGFGYQTTYSTFGVMQQLALCRFLLGIGIGGEYPLAATVASEANSNHADTEAPRKGCWYHRKKPNSIACVFSMQGIGMLLSPLVLLFCLGSGLGLESTWRFCLGLGALPSAIAFYFRWQMVETTAFRKSKRRMSLVSYADTSVGLFDSKFASSVSSVSNSSAPHGNKLETPDTQADDVENSPAATQASCKQQNADWLETTSNSEISPTASEMSATRKKRLTFGNHLKMLWRTLARYKLILVGTSLTWFLIDVTFYGTGTYKSTVVGQWFVDQPSNLHRRLSTSSLHSPMQLNRNFVLKFIRKAVHTESLSADADQPNATTLRSRLISSLRCLTAPNVTGDPMDIVMKEASIGAIVACISIPGYILSVLLIHKTGLRRLQLWGFVAVAVSFFLLSAEQFVNFNSNILEVALLGLTFLFTNFGPNTTTFILPTTVYPTLVRATCHGFSAAMGKLGGVVGTALFKPVLVRMGLAWVFLFCGVVGILGAVVTYFFVPTDSKAHKILRQEQADTFRLSRCHRYTKRHDIGAHAIEISTSPAAFV